LLGRAWRILDTPAPDLLLKYASTLTLDADNLAAAEQLIALHRLAAGQASYPQEVNRRIRADA
jgi:hypothetical protein